MYWQTGYHTDTWCIDRLVTTLTLDILVTTLTLDILTDWLPHWHLMYWQTDYYTGTWWNTGYYTEIWCDWWLLTDYLPHWFMMYWLTVYHTDTWYDWHIDWLFSQGHLMNWLISCHIHKWYDWWMNRLTDWLPHQHYHYMISVVATSWTITHKTTHKALCDFVLQKTKRRHFSPPYISINQHCLSLLLVSLQCVCVRVCVCACVCVHVANTQLCFIPCCIHYLLIAC